MGKPSNHTILKAIVAVWVVISLSQLRQIYNVGLSSVEDSIESNSAPDVVQNDLQPLPEGNKKEANGDLKRAYYDSGEGDADDDDGTEDKQKVSPKKTTIEDSKSAPKTSIGKDNASASGVEVNVEEIDCGCPITCDKVALRSSNNRILCRDHIRKLMKEGHDQEQACTISSLEEGESTNKAKPCGVECNPKYCKAMTKKKDIDCGCPHSCDKVALQKRTPKMTCKARIQFLMERYNSAELDACEAASEDEPFQDSIMKPCEIECNPKFCKEMEGRPKMDISNIDVHDPPFKRYEGVVIVTKVLWPKDIDILKQMFCLLNAAYNRFVNYDLLVFTTMPWIEEEIADLQAHVGDAKLTVALEGPPTLEGHLADMTKEERSFLYERCNVTANENITWFHRCQEGESHLVNNLGYCWQSEFRTYHIWQHPAIQRYKYMMWIDSDAMCTKTWDVDPMKVFIENDLNLMFNHFPGGLTRLPELKDKMISAYGKSICRISLTDDGLLKPDYCREIDVKPSVRQVYGFNHITRLDMYRNETHLKFLHSLVNQYKFTRQFDDQLGVTLPAVMEDPSKCWDMYSHGVKLGIHHNTFIDGKVQGKYLSYLNFWSNVGKKNWTAARALCDGLVVDLG